MEKIMGVQLKDASFEISVHVATALALCFILRRELWLMLRSINPVHGSTSRAALGKDERTRGRLLILAVIVGSIPAAVIGITLSDRIEAAFHSVTLTLLMLPATGIFLVLTRWAKDRTLEVSGFRALIVGIAQAIAVLPGVSRSGLTVGSGLFLGITKVDAVRFSFLLSIPAIGGGAVLKLIKGSGAGSGMAGVGGENLAIAGVVAFFAALLGAKALLGVVKRGKLQYFGYYCIAVGVLGLLLLPR